MWSLLKQQMSKMYAPTGHGYVFISTNPRANHENHPIFQKEVKYGEPFFITVRPRGTRKTKFYLKIFYRCMRPNLINYRSKMIRKYVEEIPTQRISKIGRPTSLYHRGKIDLARLR
uniref:MSP domain-containing protein n=1 Tax=Strongyloides venezuelensis TaxID=75913 RepID=A0A0K0FQ39_STRVS